ncbi:MAG: Ig-like domain-containing protein [Lachnospiraceae bacterium]|nr:Ig-like domain-containing protein [Lachnospiraceae bacterium]
MKKRKSFQKFASLLLSGILLLGELGSAFHVRAADPEEPVYGEEELTADAYEDADAEDDIPAEPDGGPFSGEPTQLYVNTSSKGVVNLVTYGDSIREGDSELSYNASSCTLTMKDFHISNAYKKSGSESYGIFCDGKLNIVVEGNCSINATASSDSTVIEGIHVDQELTIRPSENLLGGSLNVAMGGSSKGTAAGIFCGYGISFSDSTIGALSVTAKGSEAKQESYGVRAGRGIIMNSGNLRATGGRVTSNSKNSYGIMSKDGDFLMKGGSITATGGSVQTSNAKSYGLYHAGDLKMNGGNLTLATASVSGDLYTEACALYVTKGLMLTKGTLTATAANAGDKAVSRAVNCTGRLVISRGTMTATAGSSGESLSVAVDAGTFIMALGKLTATAGNVSGCSRGESYALRLTDKNERETKVIGGEITAKAGNAATSYGIKVNTYFTLTGGKLTAAGYSEAISAAKSAGGGKPSITAPVFEGSADYNGSNTSVKADYVYGWKYAILDATRVVPVIDNWIYDETPSTPGLMNADRYGSEPLTIRSVGYCRARYTEPFSATVPTEAGSYILWVSTDRDMSGNTEFQIRPRDVSELTIAQAMRIPYDGYGSGGRFSVSYRDRLLKEGKDYSLNSQAGLDAGTYSVAITGMGNFKGTKSSQWRIYKREPQPDDFALGSLGPYSYDGKAKGVSLPELKSPMSGCGEISVYYNGEKEAPVNAGSYAVTFDVAGGKNISAAQGLEYGTLILKKAANPMSVRNISAGSNGRQRDLAIAVSSAVGELTYSIEGEKLGCSISGSMLTTGDSAGKIRIRATAAGNENYEEKSLYFDVEIRDLQMEELTVAQESVVYGTPLPDPQFAHGSWTAQIHYSGVTAYSEDYDSDEKPRDAGHYVVSVSGETASAIYSGSAEFDITAKPVSLEGITAQSRVYNGGTWADMKVSYPIGGVLPADEVEVGLIVLGEFADPSVGNDKAVIITEVELECPAASHAAYNYSVSEEKWPQDIKADILPCDVMVRAADQSVEAGVALPSAPGLAVLEGAAYGHVLSEVKLSGDTSVPATGRTITPSDARIADENGVDVTGNYNISYENGKLTVLGRSLEAAVVSVGGNYSYIGEELLPEPSDVAVSLDGVSLTYGTDYSYTAEDNIDAGSATIIVTGKGMYSGETYGSFEIAPCILTDPAISVGHASYTGAAVEPAVTVSSEYGLVSAAEYTVLYANNVNVGTNSALITLVDREGGNYTVSGSTTFSIGKGGPRDLGTLTRSVGIREQLSIPLASMVPQAAGTVSGYEPYEQWIETGSVIVDDITVSNDGILRMEIHGAKAGDKIHVSLIAYGTNFDCTFWVAITLNGLEDPEYTAPTAKSLSYTGAPQELLNPGSVTKGGTMEYSADGVSFDSAVPSGTEAGNYTVWYRISATATVNGLDATPVSVRIRSAVCRLKVENGKGGGEYEAGESVMITADAAPAGKVFSSWYSEDEVVFADAGAAVTSLVMPAKSVTVTATYKKDEKPLALVITEPAAKDLRCNHLSQVLIERGKASGGTMVYCLGSNDRTAPAAEEFAMTLPKAEKPAYYYVWYYVRGDSAHADTDPVCITVILKKEDGSLPEGGGGVLASAFNSVPALNALTTELHLVKGQKFAMPESGWGVSKKDKKYLNVSKKGAVSAKKVTGTGSFVILENRSTGQRIRVYISQPVFKKKSLKLEAGVSMSCGFDPGDGSLPFCFSSSAPDVAAVDPVSGKLTAVSRGSATITAFVNGKSYSCKVKVTETSPEQSRTLHLNVGGTKSISVKGLKNVEWSISSGSCVEFVKKNRLKANAPGTAILTTVYKGAEYRINVTVENCTITNTALRVKGKKYEAELSVGTKFKLDLAALDRFVAFKSSNPGVAYVNEERELVVQGKGKAKLTAKINGKSITITVKAK